MLGHLAQRLKDLEKDQDAKDVSMMRGQRPWKIAKDSIYDINVML